MLTPLRPAMVLMQQPLKGPRNPSSQKCLDLGATRARRVRNYSWCPLDLLSDWRCGQRDGGECPLASWESSREDIEEIRKAVLLAGPLGHLRVHPTAVTEFFASIAGFVGGSLDGVDAFVTQVPDAAATEHRVFWLRGNSIGSLALQAHVGAEGANVPAVLSGYVSSLDDVLQVEILGATSEWPFSGGFPRVSPDVSIHFRSGAVATIRVSDRSNEAAGRQACEFVSKLLDAMAGHSQR